MSQHVQEPSRVSTPSATVKSQKPAKAGDTVLKLQDASKALAVPEDKAIPVKAIYFDKIIKWPGIAGASSALVVGSADAGIPGNALRCDSIFLYRGEFIINGRHFMPKSAGALLTYEF